ncbi:MAG: imelysin family protein [Paracoccaceae bacterium]
MRILMILLATAAPAFADVETALTEHILPGYAAFADATEALAEKAAATCDAAALRPEWNAAYDAWLGIAHIRLGPVEDEGRGLAIAFWPDPKGLGAKQQAAMIAAQDPMGLDAAAFAEASVAVRGLTGLERLLFAEPAISGEYSCALMATTAADLAEMAGAVEAGWQGGFAEVLRVPGGENARFLTDTEVRQAMFTQLITGIEFVKDSRIARPLGTFDAPRPERAEARLSGRAGRNIVLSLTALRDYARALDPAAERTEAAFDLAIRTAAALPDPTLASITNPAEWLKLEILGQQVQAVQDAALAEIGASLDVGVGFNAADGD